MLEFGCKTLILVDNSASVSAANREITKETLKYLIRNAPEGSDFALATFTEQTELLVNYGSEEEAYLDAVDKIGYPEKSTCLTDVVMSTLNEWREADFAMRNILVFTNGLGSESATYPVEEAYFMLNECGYPMYVVGLEQQNNEFGLKRFASMARISHGAFFSTEFEDSEAEVEKKLTEKILHAMEERQKAEETKHAEEIQQSVPEEVSAEYEDAVTEEYDAGEYYGTYEEKADAKILKKSGEDAVLYLALGAGLLSVILLLLLLVRFFGRKNSTQHSVCDPEDEGDGKRIQVTLEDINNPARFYILPEQNRVVIGANRRLSDIVIEDDPDVSDRHCEILRRRGELFLNDPEAEGKTFLNGERLYFETRLQPSDVITLGRAKLMVKMPYG